MHVRQAGLAAILFLSLAACGGDSATDEGGDVRVVNIAGITFSPADLTVAVGTTVRWVNGTGAVHTVTPDGHTQWNDATLQAGGQFEHTFSTAGTFAYYCTPHRSLGMTGVIRVQ